MKINVSIIITLSKIMAFTILACAMFLDITQKTNSAFFVAAPISASLVLGKQFFDSKKRSSTVQDDSSDTVGS